jgi:hypothetical protein
MQEPQGRVNRAIVVSVRRLFPWAPVAAALATALAAAARPAEALESCQSSGASSACIDANVLWQRPGPSDFVAVAPARATPSGRVGLAVRVTWLERPLVLGVERPDSAEHELALVERAVDQELALGFGLGRGLELGVALAAALRQSGLGAGSIRSRGSDPLPTTAVRDPRLGLAWNALDTPRLALALRAELAAPLGDRDGFASSGSATAAPSVALRLELGPLLAGAELGARLRGVQTLGTLRSGSQAYSALAAALRLSPHFALSLEAFALSSLIDARSSRARELGIDVRSLPAEWLASASWRPEPSLCLRASGGSGLPLSRESSRGDSRSFLGPTSPEFRGALELRYSP